MKAVSLALSALLTSTVFAADIPAGVPNNHTFQSGQTFATPAAFRSDRILLKPKTADRLVALSSVHSTLKADVMRKFAGIGHLQVVRVPKGESVPGLIAKYEQSGLVEFAEPDYLVRAASVPMPNDPKFQDGTLWGLHNTGQGGGLTDADIDAPEGWAELTSASNIVVAVLDTGVRSTHEDLAANMWADPVDGSHGFNALTGMRNPTDDNGHGTLVSGVLGGVGNNGKGVVGVAWRVQIMACKCLDSAGNGSNSDVIECVDFARTNGARILNMSFDSPGYSQALSNAIFAARNAGIIVVASAGNNSANVDVTPRYPSCYGLDNIVSVAYTTRQDGLGTSSNFGVTNVDLGAPGDQMYSTFFASDSSYLGGVFIFGSSLAAPYVTGTLALMLAQNPADNHLDILRRLLSATDPLPALAGRCVTGGRLNVARALRPTTHLEVIPTEKGAPFQVRLVGENNRTWLIEVTTNLTSWSPIFTNTTSSTGTFEFTDHSSTNASQRFYRAISAP